MQLLVLILTVLAGIFVWVQRIRMAKKGADTVIDAADRFRKKRAAGRTAETAPETPIAAIADPVTAAATYIRFVVGPDAWPTSVGRVRARLGELATPEMAEEAVRFAEWAADQPIEKATALRTLTDMLRDWLTLPERQDLAALLEDAARSGDPRIQAEASRERLALVN